MKPKQEKIIYPVQNSIKILKYAVPYFNMLFHYHPEYELVYITKGSGLRYIGNSIHKFQDGDMVFIGPDLAHIWINPKKYHHKDSTLTTEAIVLQFSKDLFSSMAETPEFALIEDLLKNAQSGLKVVGRTRKVVSRVMEHCLNCKGMEKLTQVLKILDILSKEKDTILLNPLDYSVQSNQKDKRIHAVHHLVMSCYNQKISVRDASSVANMEESAFCRYFKDKTQKTFTQFLNGTRIDHACRLLVETKLSMGQIAYECGFNVMANFYRQFKKITGMTPGEYRKELEQV